MFAPTAPCSAAHANQRHRTTATSLPAPPLRHPYNTDQSNRAPRPPAPRQGTQPTTNGGSRRKAPDRPHTDHHTAVRRRNAAAPWGRCLGIPHQATDATPPCAGRRSSPAAGSARRERRTTLQPPRGPRHRSPPATWPRGCFPGTPRRRPTTRAALSRPRRPRPPTAVRRSRRRAGFRGRRPDTPTPRSASSSAQELGVLPTSFGRRAPPPPRLSPAARKRSGGPPAARV